MVEINPVRCHSRETCPRESGERESRRRRPREGGEPVFNTPGFPASSAGQALLEFTPL
jgi:hypothetical protein